MRENKTKTEALLLDLDGTIIDSLDGILNSMNYAFDCCHMPRLSKEALIPFIGPPILYTLQMNFGQSEAAAKEIMVFYHEYYRRQGWQEFRLYPFVDDMIQQAKEKGLKIGLATNKPIHYARQILEFLKLDEYFHYIGGSDSQKGIINKELVIKDCLEHMNIKDKASVVMMGDRHYDIEGAKDAGIKAVGITYGYGTREELEKAGAWAVFNSPLAVLDFLL